jgi:hypothetical protein
MPNLHTPELTPELYDQIHEYAHGDKPISNTTACEWLRALLAKVERPKPVVPLQVGDKVRHKTYESVYVGEVIGVKQGKARVRWIRYNFNVFWKRAPQPKWYAIDVLEKVDDDHD